MGNGCFKSDSSKAAEVDVFDKDAYLAYYHGAKFRTAPHRGNHHRVGGRGIVGVRNPTDDTGSEIASTNGSVYTPPGTTIQSSPSAPLIVKDKVITVESSPFILEGPNCPLRTCTDPSTGSFVVIDVETGMVLVSVVSVGKSEYAVSTPDGRHVTTVKKSRKSYIMENLGYKGTCEGGGSDRLCITGPSCACSVENRSQVIVTNSDSINEGVDMLVVFLFNAINIIENK